MQFDDIKKYLDEHHSTRKFFTGLVQYAAVFLISNQVELLQSVPPAYMGLAVAGFALLNSVWNHYTHNPEKYPVIGGLVKKPNRK